MDGIFVCIPTLKRYDLLWNVIDSANKGTMKPDRFFIIDNGGKFEHRGDKNVFVFSPGGNLGVAKSWNVFISNVPEYRIICNDDIEFYEDTIELLIKNYDENFILYPEGVPSANSFSCFLIPNKIPKTIGMFDEEISPGYAYFEDNDYHRRMKFAGFDIKGIKDARLNHANSSTLKSYNFQEEQLHHILFRRARQNYIKKWGGLPGEEIYSEPYELPGYMEE